MTTSETSSSPACPHGITELGGACVSLCAVLPKQTPDPEASPVFSNVTFIPLDELVEPRDGCTVLTDRWWVVHPRKGALVYKRYIPQCNRHRSLPDRLIENRYPGCESVFVPIAYVEDDPWTE